MPVRRIISGGQTGADRGALDAAIELGIEHGGFCPRGRRAEDGVIPSRYNLVEDRSSYYSSRTGRNVLEANATLVVVGGGLGPGSILTLALCRRHSRPYLLVESADPLWVKTWGLTGFLNRVSPAVLTVAGSRESRCPGIGEATRLLLVKVLGGGYGS
jgi:hypothetical protein